MKREMLILVGAAVVLAASPASAHHSGAMFDRSKHVELKGTIKAFGWTNPHAWVAINVKNAQGVAEEWSIEAGSPTVMAKQGWRKSSLKPGDEVTLYISPMRDGTKGGTLEGALTAAGEKIGRGGTLNPT
ncbi:MAG: DUF6152 family protein [Caulobacteraceae bacterium]